MTISTNAARQGVNVANHAITRILVTSTSFTFISLAFVAFVTKF